MTDFEVRIPRVAELDALPGVERASDAMFEGVRFPPGSILDELDASHSVFVVGSPPVGFLVSGPLDDGMHVHQVSVDPEYGRRGLGTALLSAAVRAAGPRPVTLTTFADVPWNAPWYARQGFSVLPEEEWGAGLRAVIEAERAAGLEKIGPRVVMRRVAG
ncbi:GNAT family N-acetyltransferase [Amycolatopsis anabasis]|uniref:GNAT family N-acetyltransferase n=1 Tax=Amycolatopsis anabasis TaxID=1840409 RepID=UPI001FE8D2D3|nr:GNAT family N-acetyltransferase [Amycolatopsis anabasis]